MNQQNEVLFAPLVWWSNEVCSENNEVNEKAERELKDSQKTAKRQPKDSQKTANRQPKDSQKTAKRLLRDCWETTERLLRDYWETEWRLSEEFLKVTDGHSHKHTQTNRATSWAPSGAKKCTFMA